MFVCFFFLFFLHCLLSRVAGRVVVHRPGVRPEPPRWESQVQDITTRDLPGPHNINWRELSQRSPSQQKDPAPPNSQQAPARHAPCQKTSKTGTQSHPLAERLPKIILSSQTSQNTLPDIALPTRTTSSSPTHEKTGTSPFHQEAYTSC